MDVQDAVSALQLVSSGAVLCYASVLDWRTRRVGNVVWLLLSAAAALLLISRIVSDEAPVEYVLVLVPVLAILADVYGQSEEAKGPRRFLPIVLYLAAVVTTIYLAFLWGEDEYFAGLLTVPIMMLIVVVMYMLDVIKGGADAKALMALSIMFPFHPSIGPFPLVESGTSSAELFFPFAFVILVTAAVVVALMPLAFMVKNLAAGDFSFPYAFLGYRLDAEEARTRHVWLMESMEDGVHARHTRPRAEEDLSAELDKLASAGYTKVWVTPKVPFIIPMTFALAFTVVVGNILFILMGL